LPEALRDEADGASPIPPAADRAVFFDGLSSRRHDVWLRFVAQGIEIVEGETKLALWRWENLRRAQSVGGLRLSDAEGPELARLDVLDRDKARQIATRAPSLDAAAEKSGAWRIVAWSLAAAASLAGVAFFGVPLLADVLAPRTPEAVERKIGQAVDNQLRTLVSAKTCESAAGQAAVEKLVGTIAKQIPTRFPVVPAILDSSIPNAVALPGGKIYIFRALIEEAKDADEVAAVVAHEIGHVANHDGMRRLIQSSGTSYLLGLMFGDVAGSTVVLTLANELAGASYSREAETRADATAIGAMRGLGRSPLGLGELLQRLSPDESGNGVGNLLRSHPLSSERLEAVRRADGPATGAPLLSQAEWEALRAACGTKPAETGQKRPKAAKPDAPPSAASKPGTDGANKRFSP
jgi:Zn-dependent protease with chaperone function